MQYTRKIASPRSLWHDWLKKGTLKKWSSKSIECFTFIGKEQHIF